MHHPFLALLLVLFASLGVILRPLAFCPPDDDDDTDDTDDTDDPEDKDDADDKDDDTDDEEDKPVTAKAHRKALAKERAKAARRLRRLEKRNKEELSKLREDLGLDPEGEDDDEDLDDAPARKKAAKKKGNPWAARAKKEREKREALERKLAQRDAESSIRKAAKRFKGDADLLIDVLGHKVTMEDDEPFVEMIVDGERVQLGIEEAVEETLRQKPALLRSRKTGGGAGTRKPGGGRGGKKAGGGKKPETFDDAEAETIRRLKEL